MFAFVYGQKKKITNEHVQAIRKVKKNVPKLTIIIRCLSALCISDMCENANDAKRKPIKLVFLPFCRDLNSEMARPSVLRFSIQQSKKRHQTTDLLLCVFLESTSTTTATTQTTHNYYFFCVRLFHILIE